MSTSWNLGNEGSSQIIQSASGGGDDVRITIATDDGNSETLLNFDQLGLGGDEGTGISSRIETLGSTGSNIILSLTDVPPGTAGSYTWTDLTVDTQGRITAAADGQLLVADDAGTVAALDGSITKWNILGNSGVTTTLSGSIDEPVLTISLTDIPGTAGNYYLPQLTVGADGRITDIDFTSYKQNVRVATVSNGSLATAFAAGQSVDGVTLEVDDRILLKNQTDQVQNGIYVVTNDIPDRSTDFAAGSFQGGTWVYCVEGTVNSDTVFTQPSAPDEVNLDPIIFQAFGAGAGAMTFNVSGDGGVSFSIQNADTLQIVGGPGLSTVGTIAKVIGVNLDDTAVSAGNYVLPTFTVDAKGRLTAAGFSSVKENVVTATTGPQSLGTDFDAGDTIDGVVLAANDRVLIKDQANPVENGIYVVVGVGTPVRSADFAAPTIQFATRVMNSNDNRFYVVGGATALTSVVGTNNITATLIQADSVWTISGGGVDRTITGGEKVTLIGAQGISTLVAPDGNNSQCTITLDDTTVAAGSYTNASITVNAQGRLTAASSGTAPMISWSLNGNDIEDGDDVTLAGSGPITAITTTPGPVVTFGLAQVGGAGTTELAATTVDNFGRVTGTSFNDTSYKTSVVVATAVAGIIGTDFDNGSIIDGIAVSTGDRILIKNQADPIQNGIYIVQVGGSPVRAPDWDTGSTQNGATVYAIRGNTQAGLWSLAQQNITVNTDGVTFSNFSYTWSIDADAGGPTTVDSGDTVTISGTAPISTLIAGTNLSISLDTTAVTAGTYTLPTITVDTQGRLTEADFTSVKNTVETCTSNNVTLATLIPGVVLNGWTLATGDRVLVKNQTNDIDNGIYVIQAAGPPLRSEDFAPGSVQYATFIPVKGNSPGTVGYKSWWTLGGETLALSTVATDPMIAERNFAESSWTMGGDSGVDKAVLTDYAVDFKGTQGISTETSDSANPDTFDLTIKLEDTAVTPGSYNFASITVDQQGRLTAASTGVPPVFSFDIDGDATSVAQTIGSGQTLEFEGDNGITAVTGATRKVTISLGDTLLGVTTTENAIMVTNAQGRITGLSYTNSTYKPSVRASSTGPGTLATDFAAGQEIDGITLDVGDRILIKNQADPVENGIYEVQGAGAPVRTDDFATASSQNSAVTYVRDGDQEGLWCLINAVPSVNTQSANWQTLGEYEWTASADGGSDITVLGGDTLDFSGGVGIDTAMEPGTVAIKLADLGNAGTYEATRSTVDAQGRISVQSYNDTSYKVVTRVATTVNGTLGSSFAAGDTIDGVILDELDRILIKNQGTASENGIYIVQALGAPERAADWDTSSSQIKGTQIYVTDGTNAGTWTLAAAVADVGTDTATFERMAGGNYVWSIQGDSGGPTDIEDSDNVIIAGSDPITTALAGNTLTISLDNASAEAGLFELAQLTFDAAGLQTGATFDGVTFKTRVVTASSVAGTLATDFAAGETVGDVVLTLADRILIKNQATATENGIYIVTAGAPTLAPDWAAGSTQGNSLIWVNAGDERGFWRNEVVGVQGVASYTFGSVSNRLFAADVGTYQVLYDEPLNINGIGPISTSVSGNIAISLDTSGVDAGQYELAKWTITDKGLVSEASYSNTSYKVIARLATSTVVTIATDLFDGETLDGKTIAQGDRILVAGQAGPAEVENGIYIAGGPANTPPTARASDWQSGQSAGAQIYVYDGDDNSGMYVSFIAGGAGTGTVGVAAFNFSRPITRNKTTVEPEYFLPRIQVDEYLQISSLDYNFTPYKYGVTVATTAPITLPDDIFAGETIDGVVLQATNRVLVKDQGGPGEIDNGIYEVQAAAAPRTVDFATGSFQRSGSIINVDEGATNEGFWKLSADADVNTDPVNFERVPGTGGGAGWTMAGDTQSSVIPDGGTANILGGDFAESTVGPPGTLTLDVVPPAIAADSLAYGTIWPSADFTVTSGWITRQTYENTYFKPAVFVSTTTNINPVTALLEGQTIDGETLAAGNRVLVKDQLIAQQNGIYEVRGGGLAALRSADWADGENQIVGSEVLVRSGDTQASLYMCTAGGQVATDPITFARVPSLGDAGFTITGDTGSQVCGPGQTLSVDSDGTGIVTAVTFDPAGPVLTITGGLDVGGLGNGVYSGNSPLISVEDGFITNLTYTGSRYLNACYCATTGAITINTAIVVGQTIDGITLRDQMRVLVKNQDGDNFDVDNGIYVVNQGALPTRAVDWWGQGGPHTTVVQFPWVVIPVGGGATQSGVYVADNDGGPSHVGAVGTQGFNFTKLGGGSEWTLTADTGTPAVISDGETVQIQGSTYVDTSIAGNVVTVAAGTTVGELGNGSTQLATMTITDGFVTSQTYAQTLVKVNVSCATTAEIDVNTGVVVGAVIDGHTLVNNDVVLVKNQSNPVQNGLWQARSGTTPIRPEQFAAELQQSGAVALIQFGDTNKGWWQVDFGGASTGTPGTNGNTWERATETDGFEVVGNTGQGSAQTVDPNDELVIKGSDETNIYVTAASPGGTPTLTIEQELPTIFVKSILCFNADLGFDITANSEFPVPGVQIPGAASGYTWQIGDLVFLCNQTDTTENGIYRITGVSPGSNERWEGMPEGIDVAGWKIRSTTSGADWGAFNMSGIDWVIGWPAGTQNSNAGRVSRIVGDAGVWPIYNSAGPPIGTIQPWCSASDNLPIGYLLADGTAKAVATDEFAEPYPLNVLYDYLQTTWGPGGGGGGEFNLPDLRGSMAFGTGQAGGVGPNFSVGDTGGNHQATVGVGNLPNHYHAITTMDAGGNPNINVNAGFAQGNEIGTQLANVSTADDVNGASSANTPLEIINPYATIKWIIRVI